MPKKNRLNLVVAYQHLDKYTNNSALTVEEKALFFDIKNRIGTVLKQSGWLKYADSPYIRDLHFTKLKPNSETKPIAKDSPSAEDLTHLAKKAYQSTHQFTVNVLEKLLLDYPYIRSLTNDELKQDKTTAIISKPQHKETLAMLQRCIAATLLILDQNRRDIYGRTLKKIEHDTFSKGDTLLELMILLGASYVPTNQALDPLRGGITKKAGFIEENGNCAGHTMSWGHEVEKEGYHVQLRRCTEDTVYYQDNQSDILQGSAKLRSLENVPYRKYRNITKSSDIARGLDSLFYNFSSSYCYAIFIANEPHIKHAVGIRQIPGSSTIEFMDSSLVNSAVFDNIEKFKIWYRYYIEVCFAENEKNELHLFPISLQPKNALPSIPHMAKEIDNKEHKFALPASSSPCYAMEAIKLASHIKCSDKQKASENYFAFLNQRHLNTIQKIRSLLNLPTQSGHLETVTAAKEQSNLKAKAYAILNAQIELLTKNSYMDKDKKINALIVLKQRIQAAEVTHTIQQIIDDWSLEEYSSTKFTNKSIIRKPDFQNYNTSSSYDCINKLREHGEFNLALIQLLQEELLICLAGLFRKDWRNVSFFFSKRTSLPDLSNITLPEKLNNVHSTLCEFANGKIHFFETLTAIKKHSHGQEFTDKVALVKFCEIFTELEIANASSLKTAIAKLERFDKSSLLTSKIDEKKDIKNALNPLL